MGKVLVIWKVLVCEEVPDPLELANRIMGDLPLLFLIFVKNTLQYLMAQKLILMFEVIVCFCYINS